MSGTADRGTIEPGAKDLGPADDRPVMTSTRRARAVLALRLLVTVSLLIGIGFWLPWNTLVVAIRRVPVPLWGLVLLGFLGGHATSALKWRLLLAACGARAGFGEVLRAHAAGLFANLFLPSLVGGDVVRAGLAARGRTVERVAVGTVADRAIDTAALLALIAGAWPFLPATPDASTGRLLLGLGVVLVLVAGAVATVGALLLAPARLPRRLQRPAERVRLAVAALFRHPGRALVAGLVALAVQTAFVLLAVALGRAMGLMLPIAAWLFLWPLAKLVAMVPVSLGGIGVREIAWSALTAPFGVAPSLAVGLALLWNTVILAGSLVAGAVALWASFHRPQAPSPRRPRATRL